MKKRTTFIVKNNIHWGKCWLIWQLIVTILVSLQSATFGLLVILVPSHIAFHIWKTLSQALPCYQARTYHTFCHSTVQRLRIYGQSLWTSWHRFTDFSKFFDLRALTSHFLWSESLDFPLSLCLYKLMLFRWNHLFLDQDPEH